VTLVVGIASVETVRALRARADPGNAGNVARVRRVSRPGAPSAAARGDPRVVGFLQRWLESVTRSRGRDIMPFYAERVAFSGAVRDRANVMGSWTEQLSEPTSFVLLDLQRLEVSSEPGDASSVPGACRDVAGARGDVVRVRVHASADRSGGNRWVPCRHLEGPYNFRLRETANGYLICHEYWSLQDAICTSCPNAPACSR